MGAFDQFIETPEGQEPPSLTDREFSKLGLLRTQDRKASIQRMESLEIQPGPTYQFAFWGIAQFMDAIKWNITGVMPGMNIDFNNFCKCPPVHCSVYSLKTGFSRDDDKRHLESRKNYYFNAAFWSSEHPITQERLLKFFPDASS